MPSKILLGKIESYDLNKVESFVRKGVELFSGSAPLFGPGQKVLLKPNLLRGAGPEKCVTTHPLVLEAVCRVLRDCSVGEIDVSDSPALGSLRSVAGKAGYTPLEKKYGVRILPFTHPVPLETEEQVPALKLAGSLGDYDRVINLPKVKSHRQMTLTLSIKNLFGCVIGKRKPVLHCLVDNDKVKFGRMLVDIAKHIDPCLTIVDGIEAMEGNGPINGTPYPLGILAAGRDLTALDRVFVEILRVSPDRVPALEAARQRRFGHYDLEQIELIGETDLPSLRVTDFHLAAAPMDISFHPRHLVKSFLKQVYEIGIREKLVR